MPHARPKPGDVIVVWQWRTGLLTSALARKGRTVISLCWLTPYPGEWLAPLSMKALERKDTWVGVNSPATKAQLGAVYGVEDLSRVFWVPDVPEEGVPEFQERQPANRRYCFTGGVNNRDWSLLLEGAARREDLDFECVARSYDWAAKTTGREIPENVTARFDTSEDEYYGLLRGAHCLLLPLCDDSVAGLINIIKAICWGVIPVFSHNTAMEQYLPGDLRDTLQFEVGDMDDMLAKFDTVWELDEESYAGIVARLQAHLAANFTSERAIECIDAVIQRATA